ncbi:MAG: hypothetical protein CVU72_04025, partial [Deltaproteobacteria bacterium HGW-Deltaproteobacteria-7]
LIAMHRLFADKAEHYHMCFRHRYLSINLFYSLKYNSQDNSITLFGKENLEVVFRYSVSFTSKLSMKQIRDNWEGQTPKWLTNA